MVTGEKEGVAQGVWFEVFQTQRKPNVSKT